MDDCIKRPRDFECYEQCYHVFELCHYRSNCMGFLFMKCPTVLLGVVFIYNGAVAFKLINFLGSQEVPMLASYNFCDLWQIIYNTNTQIFNESAVKNWYFKKKKFNQNVLHLSNGNIFKLI